MKNFKGKYINILAAKGRKGWRINNRSEGYEIGYIEWFKDWKVLRFQSFRTMRV